MNKKIANMRIAAQIAVETHQLLKKSIKADTTTNQLDKIATEFIKSKGGKPAFKGFQGFPKSICTSINEEVVHGIPSERKLKIGDIISIDVGVYYEGYYADTAWTYPVGKISSEKEFLMEKTLASLEQACKSIKAGVDVHEIGRLIEKYLKPYNLGIVEDLVGHGIGENLHEAPDIPNYYKKEKGMTLKAGMVLAIEPMINLGTKKVLIKEDGWTIITADQKPSAHFEHMVLVLKDGFEILTKR